MDKTEYATSIPVSAQGIVGRAIDGQCSPRAAIKAKCLVCSNFDREEVRECTVNLCPLHQFRPFTGKRIRQQIEESDGGE